MELSTAVLEPPEKRTITVIQSPARPVADEDSAGVTAPADSAMPSDSAEVADSAEDQDSAGVDEPAVVDDLAGDADPAQEEDSAGVADSADREDSAAADSAGGADPVGQGTPARTTPARSQTPDQQGQDSTMISEDGSVIFPSLPRRINQANLLDFISMMTLMQRRMDTVMPVPDTQNRPTVETPRTRDSQTPPRRSRTPVRRHRGMDESSWMSPGLQEFHKIQVSYQKIFIIRVFDQGWITSELLSSSRHGREHQG